MLSDGKYYIINFCDRERLSNKIYYIKKAIDNANILTIIPVCNIYHLHNILMFIIFISIFYLLIVSLYLESLFLLYW